MSASTELPIAFREAAENDSGLIFDSWLKEYRVSRLGTQIDSDVFFPYYRRHIGRVLRVSRITLVCNPDDQDQIYGYAVHRLHGDVRVLSWMFVKGPFRAMGIGRKLFDQIGGAEVVTHLSRQIINSPHHVERPGQIRLPEDIVYNPFLDLFLQESSH